MQWRSYEGLKATQAHGHFLLDQGKIRQFAALPHPPPMETSHAPRLVTWEMMPVKLKELNKLELEGL
jgi:hypothetical protein